MKYQCIGILLLVAVTTGCAVAAGAVAGAAVADSGDAKQDRNSGAVFEAMAKASAAATGYELAQDVPERIAGEVFSALGAEPIDCWQDFPGAALCAVLEREENEFSKQELPPFSLVYAKADLDEGIGGALPLNPWTRTEAREYWRSYLYDGMQVIRVHRSGEGETIKVAVVFEPAE